MLQVDSLKVDYKLNNAWLRALDGISFSHKADDRLGIIGESGSGKSTLALSLMGLIEAPHKTFGHITFQEKNINQISSQELNEIRWKEMAMVFQNSFEVLNPLIKVEQIVEPLIKKEKLSKKEGLLEQNRLLELVGLNPSWKDAYPHQLSGGMYQRILIAMALSCQPKLLILDEPTSSLDYQSKKEIIALINNLQEEFSFSTIVISHDLSVVTELTSKLAIMYAGSMVEKGITEEILEFPQHPYTRGLLYASAELFPHKDLWGIPGESILSQDIKGCNFSPRCTQLGEQCLLSKPKLEFISEKRQIACHKKGIEELLQVKKLSKSYYINEREIKAVEDVSFSIRQGETLALVGRSGSGKSTIAKIVAGYLEKDAGELSFYDENIRDNSLACIENGIQLVLQDPFVSLSHRFTVEEAIKEPLVINSLLGERERLERVKESLRDVQLSTDDNFRNRYCSSLSGGQRQRVAIARALVMRPKLLLADEITSMLDLSTQANIIRLLKGLQNSRGFAMLYISHDLHLARKISEKVIILQEGKVIDEGSANILFAKRKKCYGN